MASSAGIEGNEGRLAYASSKAAMISATKVLARELGRYNVRANAIAPGISYVAAATKNACHNTFGLNLNNSDEGLIRLIKKPCWIIY